MEYLQVINNWKSFANAVEKLGGDVQSLSIEEPATETEIVDLERALGFALSLSMKEVLMNFSKKVEFRWFLPEGYELEGELSEIFSGDRHWSLEWIKQFNEDKTGG